MKSDEHLFDEDAPLGQGRRTRAEWSNSQVACDRIYEAAYGEGMTVTKILRKMKQDRRSGRWPVQLRVLVE